MRINFFGPGQPLVEMKERVFSRIRQFMYVRQHTYTFEVGDKRLLLISLCNLCVLCVSVVTNSYQ